MEAETATPAYESLFNRGVAVALDDGVWLGVTIYPLSYLPSSLLDDGLFLGIWFLVFASLWFNYFTFCEWRWGKTLGKHVMGIKVIDADGGENLGFGPASIRNLLRLVDFFVVGELMIANSERHQRLGDRVAGTIVVRTRPITVPQPAPPAPARAYSDASGYATVWARLAAFLVDWLLFNFIFWVALGAVAGDSSSSSSDAAVGWGILIGVIVWFNYFAICEARWGQTLGKKLLGIKVSFENRDRGHYASALWRALLQLIDVFLVGPVLIAGSVKHQRLGDLAANTVVMRGSSR